MQKINNIPILLIKNYPITAKLLKRFDNMIEGVKIDENTILIGNKPPMSYVLAVVTQFNKGSDTVLLKARGRAITRAVDTAEIVRNRFVTEAKIGNINIGTESISNEEGRTRNVSFIEIDLTTKQ